MSSISRLAWVFLGLWLLGLAPALGQEKPLKKPWTGKLADGRVISQADLDKILQDHKLWLEGDGKKGKMADLGGADLTEADLSKADLRWANFSNANLSRADLLRADLSKAHLFHAVLISAGLGGANLNEAYLNNADLSKSILRDADLINAELMEANLSGAYLGGANLKWAFLYGANLSGAVLRQANLNGANLTRADLRNADLRWANLTEAMFEPLPGTLPDLSHLFPAKGLSTLTYKNSPHGLVELRETFKKAGLRDQEREVTFALNHTRRINAWEGEGVVGKIESLFNLICFEWTCRYGLNPGRALRVIGLGLVVFSIPYMLALRSRTPRAGIWLLLLPDRVLDRQIKDRPVKLTFRTPLRPLPAKMWARFLRRCQKVWRALRLAFYFSLLSAFNIGWRELNVGNWISRIQKREYILKGTGWVRMLSGIQALLSVYLLALWALTYFGRPFE